MQKVVFEELTSEIICDAFIVAPYQVRD
ncbi:hypothetical protein EMIT048CA2_90092 [Pseudomonas chlororaphis]